MIMVGHRFCEESRLLFQEIDQDQKFLEIEYKVHIFKREKKHYNLHLLILATVDIHIV